MCRANTKLNFQFSNVSCFVAVDNVLDKDYDGYAYTSSGKNYHPADGTICVVGV